MVVTSAVWNSRRTKIAGGLNSPGAYLEDFGFRTCICCPSSPKQMHTYIKKKPPTEASHDRRDWHHPCSQPVSSSSSA